MPKRNDRKSGSISYNRLDMQISQVLHLAIELYNSCDYLFILDHYDDITLFHNQSLKDAVSFYQLKTCQKSFSLNTIISESWLAKLYSHFEENLAPIRELGLITNSPIVLSKSKTIQEDKTMFTSLDQDTIDIIKTDLALKMSIPKESIDLSRFAHIKTTLSIERHKDIVEKETGDFLIEMYPDIRLETVKAIFSSIIMLLTQLQSYELADENAPLESVISSKGFSRDIFDKIIKAAILISMPSFNEIQRLSDEYCYEPALSVAYVHLLSDTRDATISFRRMFDTIYEIVQNTQKTIAESFWQFSERCKAAFQDHYPDSIYLHETFYMNVLILSIMINK